MSKKYKGWEILKMTEERKFKEGDRIAVNDVVYFTFNGSYAWLDRDKHVVGISSFTLANFEIIQKAVDFMEALNSGKNCWVEHPYISWVECLDCDGRTKRCFEILIQKQPQSIKDVLRVLSYKCSDNKSFVEIINDGEWYIEE
ncbi:hypothetical protein [Clostridium botulinum]|uniref:hypothetical protein n=1 Tax=Clostridium botulinum TaxID=1491 RepID=UPI0004D63A72|nr:hypothetical protein [Clostridium botulinum]KEH99736.1 hypothetical protein Z952_p0060 [Clostridium botulinum C/D str. BKT75002]KEI05214.1 phage protein [Clostridium botulinum C/D str. BKT2873]QPW62107.1 hypothetical protein IG390_13700 [Clostridium botulinum]